MAPKREKTRSEWDTPTKNRVRALIHEAKWSQRQVAKELGIPRTTVKRLARDDEPRRAGKARPGRPHLLSASEIDRVIERIKENGWPTRTLAWDKLGKECNLTVRESRSYEILINKLYRSQDGLFIES